MDTRKWSQDWANFDWSRLEENSDRLDEINIEEDAKEVLELSKSDMEEHL